MSDAPFGMILESPLQDEEPRAGLQGLIGGKLALSGRRPDGKPAFASLAVGEIANRARLEPLEPYQIKWAQQTIRRSEHRLLIDGVDPCRAGQAGWGAVFPANGRAEIRDALRPLLEWRRTQVSEVDASRFRDLHGDQGYRCGETRLDFLDRHKASRDLVDPRQLPYYLMLVGSPEEIPFSFQSQLDLQHGVGRLDFETPDEYASYAKSLVDSERKPAPEGKRRAVFFWPTDDEVAQRISRKLMEPLLRRLDVEPVPDWEVEAVLGEAATRRKLVALLGGEESPDLLFTAGHGLCCEAGAVGQKEQQGGLWCQDGPVVASDLRARSCLQGRLTFHFACFGLGTDRWDEFETNGDGSPVPRAEKPFTSRLPQSLLSRGVSAVLGHVGRSWTSSFYQKATDLGDDQPQQGSTQLATFEMTLRRLLQGAPVAHALEPFNVRFAAMTAELAYLNQAHKFGASTDQRHAEAFRCYLDARNFVVLGDPLARLYST